MARSLRIQYSGAFYHVTCRGNERKKIFLDDDDHHRFLVQLAESLETYQVVLYAYIMMPNHFHLLVQTLRANLSEFMRRFNICYTGWFNYHHGRCGHLYQGRYNAFLIDADNYLLEVSRYLHLNIVRIEKLRSTDYEHRWQHARTYRWSSLRGYCNRQTIINFVDYDLILSMVGGRRAYQRFIVDGLKNDIENPFKHAIHQGILGRDDFVKRVKSEHIKGGSVRDQPAYRRLIAEELEPGVVIGCVVEVCGIDRAALGQRRDSGVERGIVSELLYRYSGLTLKEIGRLLGGIDYSAVNKLRSRLQEKMAHDNEIKKQYVKAANKVRGLMSNVEI